MSRPNRAWRTLDIMRKEPQLQTGSDRQTPNAELDRAVAESALVTAETGYEKSRVEMQRATGSIFEENGISIADAETGVLEASHP
jgi:outer membrane protein TolC